LQNDFFSYRLGALVNNRDHSRCGKKDDAALQGFKNRHRLQAYRVPFHVHWKENRTPAAPEPDRSLESDETVALPGTLWQKQ